MHDFERRVHRQVFGRAAVDDARPVKETAAPATETTDAAKKTASPSPPPAKVTPSTTAATTVPAVETTPVIIPATTIASTPTPGISSILGVTSAVPKLPTSSSTSTLSTPTTTSSSSMVQATSPATTSSAARNLVTSTATLTSSGTAASSTSSDQASSSGGLSGAATGGIIAGCVLAGLALLIFAVRKTFIQRRKRKRNTWGAGVFPDINDKYSDGASVRDVPPPIPEKPAPSPSYLQPRTPVWAPPRPLSPNPNSYYVQPPQASYNNPMMDTAPSFAPPTAGMAGTGTAFGAQSAAKETAIVRVLYIPTLPDELSVTTGEVVQVISAYDDGWALCSNARGEQGVVPLECLDRSSQGQADRLSVGYGQQGNGNDWRSMRRISSLSTEQPRY